MSEEGEKGIITYPNLFSEDFIPVAMPITELQIKELHFYLIPILKGEKSLNILIATNNKVLVHL